MALSTSTWVSQSNAASLGGNDATFERRLDITESSFYWDRVFQGTADTLDSAELEVDPTKFEEIISVSNVTRTWSSLKQQFPLLGASIEERDANNMFFVVNTEKLKRSRPGEITFQDIASAEEATEMSKAIIANGGFLSNDLLARIWILRRTDRPNTFSFVIHVAHVITDGMSNITIKKTFWDELCRNSSPIPPVLDLARQLSLSEGSQNLYPTLRYSLPRRRWRTAIAKTIAARRSVKLTGGHTLPRKISQRTPYTPADSKTTGYNFSVDKTRSIISTCRKRQITFGNAYPIIGQIATTRLLLRHYLRGDIDEEEWQFRKREPMSSAGPLNLRPFLDKEWIAAGGFSHVCVSIGFMFFSLPFMPLGAATNIRPGTNLPPFATLLSKERFFLRSRSVKDQTKNYMRHLLFLELGAISHPGRLERATTSAFQWRKEKGAPKNLPATPFSPAEQAAQGFVMGNGGSSMGNVDLLLPREYPLNRHASEKPTIRLRNGESRLHCRPTELYLGATTSDQRLRLHIHWDNNVTDEAIVMEWLEEVKGAVDFYLAQDVDIKARL